MQLNHYVVWYNGMGGSPVVSFVGDFLLEASQEHFGTSFDAIELYAHVPSRHVDTKLADLALRFEERTRSLPKYGIKRKKRRIELAYNSRLGFAEDLVTDQRRAPLVADFRLACQETIGVLRWLRAKLRRPDDLSIDNMIDYFERRQAAMPETQEQLSDMLVWLRKRAASRLAP